MIDKDMIWPALIAHQGEIMYTTGRGAKSGVSFTYRITGGEMRVSRKEKAITRSTLFSGLPTCRRYGWDMVKTEKTHATGAERMENS